MRQFAAHRKPAGAPCAAVFLRPRVALRKAEARSTVPERLGSHELPARRSRATTPRAVARKRVLNNTLFAGFAALAT